MTDDDPYAGLPVDHDTLAYWDGCRERQLRIARCGSCGHWIHFPRAVCPACWSDDVTPTPVSGRGHVYTFAVFHEQAGPYVAAVVELEESTELRVPTTIVGCDAADVAIGMAVEVTWLEHRGLPVPAFAPADGSP